MLMDLLAEKKKKKVQKVGLQGKKDVEVEMVASSSSSSASSSFCLSSPAPAAVTTPITIPTNPFVLTSLQRGAKTEVVYINSSDSEVDFEDLGKFLAFFSVLLSFSGTLNFFFFFFIHHKLVQSPS